MSAISAQPVSTGRLTLVPLAAGHADEKAAVLADPELYAFTGGSPPTGQELRSRYERWIVGSTDPAVSWCNWVIQLRSPLCLAGTVQATIRTADEPVAEVAWVVGTAAGLTPTGLVQDGETRWRLTMTPASSPWLDPGRVME